MKKIIVLIFLFFVVLVIWQVSMQAIFTIGLGVGFYIDVAEIIMMALIVTAALVVGCFLFAILLVAGSALFGWLEED